MKRIRILVFGLLLLTAFCWIWIARTKPGEVLTSYTFMAIDAPVDRVWNLLTDVSKYPEWNPYVVKVNGTLSAGASLRIVEQVDGRSSSHSVRVAQFSPATHELGWRGSSFIPGLMDWGEQFTVEAVDASHSRLTITAAHQGLLADYYWKHNKNRQLTAHHELAESVKKKAEQR